MKPISPQEAIKQNPQDVPDVVIESFNELIKKKISNGRAYVTQNEVVGLILEKSEYSRHQIFENHWLDVEKIYENSGWVVKYDKPAYNESYEANFVFKIK